MQLKITFMNLKKDNPLTPFKKGELNAAPFKKGELNASPFKKGELNAAPFKKGELNAAPNKKGELNATPNKKAEMNVKPIKKEKINVASIKKEKLNTVPHKKWELNTAPHKKGELNATPNKKAEMNVKPIKKEKLNVASIKKGKLNTVPHKKGELNTVSHKKGELNAVPNIKAVLNSTPIKKGKSNVTPFKKGETKVPLIRKGELKKSKPSSLQIGASKPLQKTPLKKGVRGLSLPLSKKDKGLSLTQRDISIIWHPYTQMKNAHPPIPIVKGEGVYLFDEKGNKYIDAVSSWWVNIHGHSHPYIAQKVYEQFLLLEHVIFAGFTHPKAVELAERLLKKLPASLSKIFYSDNGSTAVEVALKLAIQYWSNKGLKKNKIIAFHQGYHGDTFGAMSVSGRSIFTKAFTHFLFDVEYIQVPVKGKENEVFNEMKKIILSNDVAAFIFEPLVLGAGGMIMYEPETLEKLLQICKQNNILTIADEVMTGFGRTGKFLATDYIQSKPDIICLSKGITGGAMPLGVTGCTQAVYDAFLSDDPTKTFYHGHSYTANPLACAAACASLDLFEKQETEKNIQRITQKHAQFVNAVQKHVSVAKFRQQGTILAIEVNTTKKTNYHHPIKEKIIPFFLERNIILRPLGNVMYVLPPYCISNEELDDIYLSIEEFLKIKK